MAAAPTTQLSKPNRNPNPEPEPVDPIIRWQGVHPIKLHWQKGNWVGERCFFSRSRELSLAYNGIL